ncbi:MAG TPA: DNA polymerase III subunit delta, partial [Vicinamibacterales bacterium]
MAPGPGTPDTVRAAIAARTLDSIYLLLGDDDAEISRLASDIAATVEDELRAFNVERIYAGEKGGSPAAVVEASRQLPMMADRRIVVLLRAERFLKPKRRGRASEDEDEPVEAPSDVDVLTEYLRDPSPSTTLVIAAADVDKSRRIGKTLLKQATIVECRGLLTGQDPRRPDLREAMRRGEQLVRKAGAECGKPIEPAAVRLVAQRAGVDIVRLRGDIERLMLFAAEKPAITIADAREVVSAETAQDDWAVTNAIQQRNAPEALRQLALALDSGAVPYMIVGQLAWFVRDKLTQTDTRRVPAAIDALF